jgi:protoporphyrinogen oxidase
MKVAVLGGGVSGLTCLSQLRSREIDSFVLEGDSRVGGLAKTVMVDGYVYDSHGGHVFNSKDQAIRDWVFGLLPEDQWQVSQRIAKILHEGGLVSYPFELALWQLPVDVAVDCIADLAESRRGPEPDIFDGWVVWAFGRSIAENYLLPYNRKIWRRPLNEISSHWVQGKMPIPTLREVLYASLQRDAVENKMPHSSYYYPKQGGIQRLVDAIAASHLDCIETDTSVESIEENQGGWLINGTYTATHIISTIPVDLLITCLPDAPEPVRRAAVDLKHNPLTTVLCRRAQPAGLSWLYLPSPDYFCHRIVYQGELSGGCCPPGSFSATYEATCPASTEQILQNINGASAFAEAEYDTVLDTSYTEYAYPIYDVSFEKNIEVINSWLDTKSIRRSGRFAEWRYYNMDICMKRAFETVNDLVDTAN